MSFIRPEARATLWRWREVLAGLGTVLLGAYWMLGPGGLLGWIGAAVAATGAVLALIGLQRLRFRSAGGGPGVVQVDEGQITYFGPLTGGVVAGSELSRLTLDPTGRPPHWVLYAAGQPALHIPVNAEGADALFDVFSALPGIKTERMLAELNALPSHPVVIWERTSSQPRLGRIH